MRVTSGNDTDGAVQADTNPTCYRTASALTAQSLQAPGTPFRSYPPRSAKAIPYPITGSLTVLDNQHLSCRRLGPDPGGDVDGQRAKGHRHGRTSHSSVWRPVRSLSPRLSVAFTGSCRPAMG
jgi:hypothetical protein